MNLNNFTIKAAEVIQQAQQLVLIVYATGQAGLLR